MTQIVIREALLVPLEYLGGKKIILSCQLFAMGAVSFLCNMRAIASQNLLHGNGMDKIHAEIAREYLIWKVDVFVLALNLLV